MNIVLANLTAFQYTFRMRFVATFDDAGRPVCLFVQDGAEFARLTPTGWYAVPVEVFAAACVAGVELDSEDARLVALILDCPGLVPVAA